MSPLHVREPELLQAERRGESRRLVAVVRVGGESVDVGNTDSCVLTCRENRTTRERELGVGRFTSPVITGLADSGDCDPATDGARTTFHDDRPRRLYTRRRRAA
jgi:hypothetical protein